MNQQFITFNGLLILCEDHIRIRDGKTLWLKIMIMAFMIFVSITGVYLVASFFIEQPSPGAGIMIWGLLFSVTGITVVVKMITSSWVKKISYNKIRKAVFRKGRRGFYILDFVIPAGRKRSIILDLYDQLGFSQHSFAKLRGALNEKNIFVEEDDRSS